MRPHGKYVGVKKEVLDEDDNDYDEEPDYQDADEDDSFEEDVDTFEAMLPVDDSISRLDRVQCRMMTLYSV